MQSVRILLAFHRFVGEPEVREEFYAGQVVEASTEDAANWIGKGLAEAIEQP